MFIHSYAEDRVYLFTLVQELTEIEVAVSLIIIPLLLFGVTQMRFRAHIRDTCWGQVGVRGRGRRTHVICVSGTLGIEPIRPSETI